MLCGPGDGVAGTGVGVGAKARERPVRRAPPAVRSAGQAAASTGSAVAGGAQARLEQAYARELSPGLLCQLGLVAAEGGQELAAQDLLRRCRRDARPGSLSEELLRRSEAVLAQKRAPSGELSVLGPRRALLSVDGRLLGALPLSQPLLLGPGPHEVRLRLGGRELRSTVTITAGRGALLRFVGAAGAVTATPAVGLVVDTGGEPGPGPGEATAQALTGEATRALRAQHLVPLGYYGALAQPLDPRCASAACLHTLAQQHGLRHILSVRATSTGGGFALGVRLFDAQVRDFAADAELDCDGCTLEQAGARTFSLVAEALRRGLHRPLGLFEVTSVPPGGEVLLNGLSLGQTPLRHPAFAGEHALTVSKTGFAPYTNEVVVDPGRGAALDAVLHEASTPALPGPPGSQGPLDEPGQPLIDSHPAEPAEGAARSTPPRPPPVAPERTPTQARAVRPEPVTPLAAVRAAAPTDETRAPRPRWRIGVGATAAALGATFIGLGAVGLYRAGSCDASTGDGCGGSDSLRSAGAPLLGTGLLLAGLGVALWAAPGERLR
ncbi:MAG: PEGA domain-containing protein [Polyangia bacterium]